MIPGKQALEEPEKAYILNQVDLNRNKGAQVSGNGGSLMGNIGDGVTMGVRWDAGGVTIDWSGFKLF